jgi:hypothetical protein
LVFSIGEPPPPQHTHREIQIGKTFQQLEMTSLFGIDNLPLPWGMDNYQHWTQVYDAATAVQHDFLSKKRVKKTD